MDVTNDERPQTAPPPAGGPDPMGTSEPDMEFGHGGEEGQTTAEYALLTGAMALILGLVAAWAASTGKIGGLLDTVFDSLIGSAGG